MRECPTIQGIYVKDFFLILLIDLNFISYRKILKERPRKYKKEGQGKNWKG